MRNPNGDYEITKNMKPIFSLILTKENLILNLR